MKFRGVLSRDAANLLVVLNAQLKEKGVTVDLKVIDTMESLLQIAKIFHCSELNDLANRLTIECQLTPLSSITEPLAMNNDEPVVSTPSVVAKKTKTVIYRGQKYEIEV